MLTKRWADARHGAASTTVTVREPSVLRTPAAPLAKHVEHGNLAEGSAGLSAARAGPLEPLGGALQHGRGREAPSTRPGKGPRPRCLAQQPQKWSCVRAGLRLDEDGLAPALSSLNCVLVLSIKAALSCALVCRSHPARPSNGGRSRARTRGFDFFICQGGLGPLRHCRAFELLAGEGGCDVAVDGSSCVSDVASMFCSLFIDCLGALPFVVGRAAAWLSEGAGARCFLESAGRRGGWDSKARGLAGGFERAQASR